MMAITSQIISLPRFPPWTNVGRRSIATGQDAAALLLQKTSQASHANPNISISTTCEPKSRPPPTGDTKSTELNFPQQKKTSTLRGQSTSRSLENPPFTWSRPYVQPNLKCENQQNTTYARSFRTCARHHQGRSLDGSPTCTYSLAPMPMSKCR